MCRFDSDHRHHPGFISVPGAPERAADPLQAALPRRPARSEITGRPLTETERAPGASRERIVRPGGRPANTLPTLKNADKFFDAACELILGQSMSVHGTYSTREMCLAWRSHPAPARMPNGQAKQCTADGSADSIWFGKRSAMCKSKLTSRGGAKDQDKNWQRTLLSQQTRFVHAGSAPLTSQGGTGLLLEYAKEDNRCRISPCPQDSFWRSRT